MTNYISISQWANTSRAIGIPYPPPVTDVPAAAATQISDLTEWLGSKGWEVEWVGSVLEITATSGDVLVIDWAYSDVWAKTELGKIIQRLNALRRAVFYAYAQECFMLD